jgi:hypothetical protein
MWLGGYIPFPKTRLGLAFEQKKCEKEDSKEERVALEDGTDGH